MAIQHRRGDFNQMDPTRHLPGEPITVLSNDPNTPDGKAQYQTFAPGIVKRLVTFDEVSGLVAQAETAAANAETSEENAEASAMSASASAESAESSANTAQEYKEYVEDAIDALPPILTIDFTTGNLLADGGLLILSINTGTGNLEYLMAGGN